MLTINTTKQLYGKAWQQRRMQTYSGTGSRQDVNPNKKVCPVAWRRPIGEQAKPVLSLCQEENLYNSVITHGLGKL